MTRPALALILVLFAGAGCADKTTQPLPQTLVRQIDDLAYVHGQYFFVVRPAEALATGGTVDLSTLRVFVDDVNGSNNQGVRSGYAEIDPTVSPGASPRIVAEFDQLQPLADYEVSTFYYGERFPVLVLKQTLPPSQVLAIAYEEVLPGGARHAVGSVPPCAGTCDSIRVRMIQAPRDLLFAQAGNPDWYETDLGIAPFNIVRDHEIKSVYDLGTTNLDVSRMTLEVRRYDANQSAQTDGFKEGAERFTYVQVLGIDVFRDDGTGVPMSGPDQVVDRFTDATFLDAERGILFFPDLRPFDPRLPGRPDATAEDEVFFQSRVANSTPSIPGLRARVLWPEGMANPPGVTTSPVTPYWLVANPRVYDKRILQPQSDRRYYIHLEQSSPLAVSVP